VGKLNNVSEVNQPISFTLMREALKNLDCMVIDNQKPMRDKVAQATDPYFGDIDKYECFSELSNHLKVVDKDYSLCIVDLDFGDDGHRLGLNIANFLRKKFPHSYIVILTGFGDDVNKKDSEAAGVQKIHHKTRDLKKQIDAIVLEFINHINSISDSLDGESKKIVGGNRLSESEVKNRKFLDTILNDKDWAKNHYGKFVAIMDGEIMSENENLIMLVKSLPEGGDGVLVHQIGAETLPKNIEIMTPFRIEK